MPDYPLLDIELCDVSKEVTNMVLPEEPLLIIDIDRPTAPLQMRVGLSLVFVMVVSLLVGTVCVSRYLAVTRSVAADSLPEGFSREEPLLTHIQTALQEQASAIAALQSGSDSEPGTSKATSPALDHAIADLKSQVWPEIERVQNEWNALSEQLRTDRDARDRELSWVHYQLGISYAEQQRFHEAIREVQQALQYVSDNGLMWNQLGYCYLGVEDTVRAVQAFKKYVQLCPKDANAYDSLAEAYRLQGKWEMAEKQYRKSLEFSPALGSAHFGLGQVYEQMGRQRLAINQYRRYIELCQGNSNEWVIRSRQRLQALQAS